MSDEHERQQRERRDEWMRRHQLRAVTKGKTCWHRMIGRQARCPTDAECAGHGSTLGGWSDHASLYEARDGELVWICQPYLDPRDVPSVHAFAAEHDLTVEISATDSWWAPGSSTLLMFRLREK